jgi:CubicO group peptidase (beta-lactamase class C family)
MNPPITTLDEAQRQFPNTLAVIQNGITRGLHRGVQLFVSRDLRPVVDLAIGENLPSEALTRDHILPWLSAGKPMTALAAMQLVEQGQLDLDHPVSEVIPEFGQHGKESVTTRHLLTHTAGIEAVALGWPSTSWDEIITRICTAPLKAGAFAGEMPAYDPQRSWFILGEIVQRLRGRSIAEVLRTEIFEPLGMRDTWLAVPDLRYEEYEPRLGRIYIAQAGELRMTHSHLRETVTAPAPGSSCRGPIRELARFYEMLLCEGTWEGHTLLGAESVRQMTARHRIAQFDQTFQHTVDLGLGLIINSNQYGANTIPYGFGRRASPDSFGHGGSQSCIGFADPQHRLAVAAVANGYPGEVPHNRRFRELLTALYDDLGEG